MFQKLLVALLEVSVTLPPAQKVVGPLGVIVGVAGEGLTTMVVTVELLAQTPTLTVSVKEPEAETRIDCVVAPLLQ